MGHTFPGGISNHRADVVDIQGVSRITDKTHKQLDTTGRGVPQRACTFCQEHFDTLHMTWLRGHWFCKDCHKRWIAQNQQPEEFSEEEAPDSFARLESLHRVDRNIRLGIASLRLGGYGTGLFMAASYSFMTDILHGVVVADILTWLFLCWFDVRFHRLPVILEFIGFVILTTCVLNVEQQDSVVEANASMGMAFLGFLGTFATKGVYQLHRYMHSGG